MSTLPDAADAGTPEEQARHALEDATSQLIAGDEAACLRTLERAAALAPATIPGTQDYLYKHAACRAGAGDCDGGTVEYRAYLEDMASIEDAVRARTAAETEADVAGFANSRCPPATAKRDDEYVLRAANALGRVAARRAPDAARCAELFEAIAAHLPGAGKLDARPGGHASAIEGRAALARGAFCIAAARGCDAGYPFFQRAHAAEGAGASDESAADAWRQLRASGQVVCK